MQVFLLFTVCIGGIFATLLREEDENAFLGDFFLLFAVADILFFHVAFSLLQGFK